MSKVNRRLLSSATKCLQKQSLQQLLHLQKLHPRFVDTIKEVSKPAQKESRQITRPFGLKEPVLLNHKLSDTYSLSSIANEVFGARAKERRQKNLDYDLKHSLIFEAKSFENTKGKIFSPPISWFKQEKSLYFPDFVAQTLQGEKESFYQAISEKYSIVRLFSSVTGDQCTMTYFDRDGKDLYSKDYNSFVQEFPDFQIVDINMPTSWIKGFVLNLSLRNLKKSIPVERYDRYFILPNHILPPDIREELYCDNQCSGYIYILDKNGRIRWATSGYATPEDLTLMWKVVRGLQKEATAARNA